MARFGTTCLPRPLELAIRPMMLYADQYSRVAWPDLQDKERKQPKIISFALRSEQRFFIRA